MHVFVPYLPKGIARLSSGYPQQLDAGFSRGQRQQLRGRLLRQVGGVRGRQGGPRAAGSGRALLQGGGVRQDERAADSGRGSLAFQLGWGKNASLSTIATTTILVAATSTMILLVAVAPAVAATITATIT